MGTRMLQRRGTSAEWSAANPALGDGELGYNKTTLELKIGDGTTLWNVLPNSKIYLPRSVLDTLYSPIGAVPASIVDAAGDLIIGSANDTVARLARGADGQYLSVVGGVLTWITPPATDLSSRVAKTGDSMSGELKMRSDQAVRLSHGAVDANADIRIFTDVNGKTLVRTAAGGYGPLDAGDIYDNGNRVYSASNPPPGSGTVVSVTGTYSVAAGVGVVLANGTFTVTIPAASANNGRVINIKNTGTGTITLATSGGNIDGTATKTIVKQYDSLTVVSDGTNWFII